MDIGDRTARLVVDVEARYLGFKGLRELLSLWNRPTESARKFAVEQAALSRSMTNMSVRAGKDVERTSRSMQVMLDKHIGGVKKLEAAYKKYGLAVDKINLEQKAIGDATQTRLAKQRAATLRLAAAEQDLEKIEAFRAKQTADQLEMSEARYMRAQASVISYKDAVLRANADIQASDARTIALNKELANTYGKLTYARAAVLAGRGQAAKAGTYANAMNQQAQSDAAAAVAAEQAQARAARRAAIRASIVAGADRVAGLGIGAAGLGLVAGGWALSRAAGWKSYVAQQLSNSPLPGNQGNAFPRWALNMAAQTGASPKDIMLSLRYSSERLSTPGRPNTGLIRNYQRYANMLGLPTGGSESVPGIMQGMTAVAKNFPQWANQPGAIARMLLSAGQRMPGTTIPEFVQSIPNLLVMAGHIHRKDALPQMLGLASTLGQAGYNTGEMETQLKNLFAKVIKPSAGTTKFIDWVKKTQGIDLSGDFSMEGLQKMGIKGWLADMHSKLPMNADRSRVLSRLFPNMRGFFGALALTGNLYGPAQQNTADIMRAPGTAGTREDALARNYRRYLGLTSTQAARLQQNFNKLVITLGTALIPAGNRLLKILIPLAKNADTWTAHNKKLLIGIVNILPKVLLFSLGLKGLLIMGSLGGKALTLGRGLMAAGKWVIAFRSALTGGSGLIEAFKLASGRAKTTAKEVGAVSDVLAGSGAASLETAAFAAIGTETTGLKGLRTGIRGIGKVVGEVLPEIAAFIILLDKFQKNGTNPGKWARDLANNFLDSPLDPYLHRLGIPTLKDIAQMIPGVRGALGDNRNGSGGSNGSSRSRSGYSPGIAQSAAAGIRNVPPWRAGKGGVPFTGAAFGSFIPSDVGNTGKMSGFQNRTIAGEWLYGQGNIQSDAAREQWYQRGQPFGMLKTGGVVIDTDFVNKKKGSQPIRLPGGHKDIWRFVGYVYDPLNVASNGGIGALWDDPMGHRVLFWHMNPSRLTLKGKEGKLFHGGDAPMWSWEENGVWHMCIVTGPEARRDLTILTNPKLDAQFNGLKDQKSQIQHHYNKKSGAFAKYASGGAQGGLSYATSIGRARSYMGSINQYAAAYHIDPAVLLGFAARESGGQLGTGAVNPQGYGVMGVKASLWGSGAPGQVKGAASTLHMWVGWFLTKGAKFLPQADPYLKSIGIPHPTKNEESLLLAIAMYGWGQVSPSALQNALGYMRTMIQANNGTFPATYWRGKTTVKSSGSGKGGVNDKGYGDKNTNTRPTTPAEWESWYGTSSSNIEQAMQQAGYLTTPLSKLSPAQRATFKRLILRDINKRHGARIAHIKATVPPGELRTELIKEADSDYAQSKAHPFRFAHHYLDSAVSKRNRRTKWEQHLAGTIFSERGGLRELESGWTGINVRSLPKHGKGMYTQDNWLRYQIKRHALERQVADNTAKLYAAVHHEPKGWLPKILAQNKQTERNADKRSKEYLRRIHHKKSGAGSDIMPVQVVGQCAEYRAQNEYHKRHVKHGKSIADSSKATSTHTGNISRKMDTLISISREIATGHKRAARGGGKLAARNHASSDPHLSGGTFHHDVMMT